jgi:hypothetical protein
MMDVLMQAITPPVPSPARRWPLVLIAVALAVCALNVWLTHAWLTSRYPGHNDFASRWEGARSWLREGLNPYGAQASLNIQTLIYGRAVVEGEDPGYFAYPLYTGLIVGPLVWLDYAWASAVWMVLLEVCLIGALALHLSAISWRPPPLVLGALVLWAIFDYFAARGLVLGQPGLLVYGLQALAAWAFVRRGNITDALGGAALAVSTLKPQMGFLIVPLLLLLALRGRRWRYISAFVAVFGTLMAASFVLLPSWLFDWLAQVSIYSSYTALGSPVWIVSETIRSWTGAGAWLEGVFNLIFYAVMAVAWWGVLRTDAPPVGNVLWAIALTLTVTHLVAPRTATPHFVVFALPIVFWLSVLYHALRRYHRWRALAVAAVPLGLIVLWWLMQLNTVIVRFEHPIMYLPLPFAAFALLILGRRWWARLDAQPTT